MDFWSICCGTNKYPIQVQRPDKYFSNPIQSTILLQVYWMRKTLKKIYKHFKVTIIDLKYIFNEFEGEGPAMAILERKMY